jgi:hypothetical protein
MVGRLMSFLLDTIHAANEGLYEFKEFLRARCNAVDTDISIEFGEGVQEVVVQFVEGSAGESNECIWRLLEPATATKAEINCDRGEVTIAVEFDL